MADLFSLEGQRCLGRRDRRLSPGESNEFQHRDPTSRGLPIALGVLYPFFGILVDQDLVDAITDERHRGCIIPLFAGGRSPLASRRALLVGDAAAVWPLPPDARRRSG